MSLWSILSAPLLTGNDLRDVPPGILEILTNREVIAVYQDTAGRQGRRARFMGAPGSRPRGPGIRGYRAGSRRRAAAGELGDRRGFAAPPVKDDPIGFGGVRKPIDRLSRFRLIRRRQVQG